TSTSGARMVGSITASRGSSSVISRVLQAFDIAGRRRYHDRGRTTMALLTDDRLSDAEPKARGLARALYARVKDLPLVSPHGHTEPRWYAENAPFPDPAQLLIVPDHYVFRMLFSQGIRLEDVGVPSADGSA